VFTNIPGTLTALDQSDSLCQFLNEHSNYLTLLDNCCGYGSIITKSYVQEAQLAEVVGKEYCELSKYTVFPPRKPRSQHTYLCLRCKKESTDKIKSEEGKGTIQKG
jgi:hypothetical protein